MSTRSQVQFGYEDNKKFERTAQVYHHYDGYPEQRLLNIKEAIGKAHESYGESGGYSYRIKTTYPSDLAAFYIITHKDGAGNVEIDEHLHGDIEYLYQVWQDEETSDFYVRIYTTHQPDGEDFDENKFKLFWDNPKLDHMRVEAEGKLDDLIQQYCEVEEVA